MACVVEKHTFGSSDIANVEWNGHCTHLTRVGSVVQARLSYLGPLGLLSGCGYARQPQQLHKRHTLLYLLS